MTFNTTSLRLAMLAKMGFVEWQPPTSRLTLNPVRRIMLTEEVDLLLKANDPFFPRSEANAVMGRFRAGHFITVSRKLAPKADLKKMLGVSEVWVLCFRKPKYGGQGRLFGRFFEKNLFVGLGAQLRDDLGGKLYTDYANDVVEKWNSCVGCNVLSSDNLGDYISPLFRDMDRDDY